MQFMWKQMDTISSFKKACKKSKTPNPKNEKIKNQLKLNLNLKEIKTFDTVIKKKKKIKKKLVHQSILKNI